jgi:hypothetical protein
MRLKVTRGDQLDRIPKPQVVGSIPTGGAARIGEGCARQPRVGQIAVQMRRIDACF